MQGAHAHGSFAAWASRKNTPGRCKRYLVYPGCVDCEMFLSKSFPLTRSLGGEFRAARPACELRPARPARELRVTRPACEPCVARRLVSSVRLGLCWTAWHAYISYYHLLITVNTPTIQRRSTPHDRTRTHPR